MRLFAGQKFAEVSSAEANWIGSRITVMVDRIIHTVDGLPLTPLQRLTFIDEGDGTATMNGVRVDAETPWLDPIQQRRRYLLCGRIKGGEFSTTGMWMEPADGGNLRSRVQGSWRRLTPEERLAAGFPKNPFDEWTIEDASYWLAREVQRRASAPR